MSKLISVLIPCYNHGRFLGQALRSVLDQAYSDLEIIVVDDGSTDETADVAAAFGDRIRYIHQANAGEAMARNVLLAAATGEYVFFLDADDVLLPGALQPLADYLDTHPEDGAVYSDGYYCDADLTIVERLSDRRRYAPSGHILPFLITNSFLNHSSLYRAAAIRRHNLCFDPAYEITTDWDFLIQFAAHESFGRLDSFTYLYRIHGDNITLQTWYRRQDNLIRNRHKAMNSWFFDGLPDWSRARFLTDFLVFHLRGREAEQAELLAGSQVAALSPASRATLYQSYGLSALEAGDNRAARERLRTSLAARPRVASRGLLLVSYLPSAIVRPVLRLARRAAGREWSHPMDAMTAGGRA